MVSSPPGAASLAAPLGTDGNRERQIHDAAVQHSVVELALARLVDEAALVLGPTRTALTGAVLSLHHLGAQCVALGPLSGPLQPPRLARLLQEYRPRRQGSSCLVEGPELAAGGCRLSVAEVGVRKGSVRVRGRRPRL